MKCLLASLFITPNVAAMPPPTPFQLRELILNTSQPLVLRQLQTNWSCFDATLEEWCVKYDATVKESIIFERMQRRQGSTPQWERQRQQVEMSMQQFLQEHNTKGQEQDYWTGLTYKRSEDVPEKCRADVDFGCLGFPHVNDSATYWLSSKGANTPCHYDTYGCNVVVQVYGSKSWLLFPPETLLTSIRIPYEESSVYCLENFYAPSREQSTALQRQLHSFAYRCVLQPQDVLIVPRHWWHYVETLDTSLSVNAWIPLQLDVEAQLEECIVKLLMESFARSADNTTLKYMLNPNQLLEIAEESELLKIIKYLLTNLDANKSNAKEENPDAKKCTQPKFAYQYLSEARTDALMFEVAEMNLIPIMTRAAFSELLSENAKRFDVACLSLQSPLDNVKEILLNSICSPPVIKAIKEQFYARFKDK